MLWKLVGLVRTVIILATQNTHPITVAQLWFMLSISVMGFVVLLFTLICMASVRTIITIL